MTNVQEIKVAANSGIPNHPRWNALVLTGALPADIGADAAKDRIRRNGWRGLWDWFVFDYHHFHPTSHEALACVRGRALLRLGGEAGTDLEVGPGDALILPAGFGHKLLEASVEFTVVGAYPPGQESPAILRASDDAVASHGDRIAAVPRPDSNPFTGAAFEWWA